MIYYTQLIYVHEGQESLFLAFEEKVLPLLENYHGKLLYRVRPSAKDVVATMIDEPYEIHLLSFHSKADFEGYRDDHERKNHLGMKEKSVAKAVLIEGSIL